MSEEYEILGRLRRFLKEGYAITATDPSAPMLMTFGNGNWKMGITVTKLPDFDQLRDRIRNLESRVKALESPDYWAHYWESYYKYHKTLSSDPQGRAEYNNPNSNN